MRGVCLGVAVVVATLYLVGLGAAPFLNPSEGFHAAVAGTMVASGDWVTERVNGVRYFDKPPLLYWLMSASFQAAGPTPFAARLWSALAVVGVAAVTARIGMLLGSARLGLLAGLMVATNLGIFIYGRMVKPDALFVLCITTALAGFVVRYGGGGRWALALFYAGLGLAVLAKDILGALGPVAVIGLFFALTRERPLRPWVPWWGVLLAGAVALPWHLAVESANRGFLWYTIVDNHLLNVAQQRIYPDEDVPLGAIEFLVVTVLFFLPWSLVAPWGIARALRRPWETATDRVWLFLALWALVVVGVFALSPFKLPHYALPAFPALALLAARVWDESIEALPRSLGPRVLVGPLLLLFGAVTAAFVAVLANGVRVPPAALAAVDVASRNLAARGEVAAPVAAAAWREPILVAAILFGVAALGMVVAWRRRSPGLGVGIALGAMVAFLSTAVAPATAQFARARSAQAVAEALAFRARPDDVIAHEGPLENSGSVLLTLRRPIHIVEGRRSNLGFGATFPEARDVFWDAARLREAWGSDRRVFLLSVVPPSRSVVRGLPPSSLHALTEEGGRWLYSNRPE